MCAFGFAWRNRSKAGVVITASPSQFTPRTTIRSRCRLSFVDGWLIQRSGNLRLEVSQVFGVCRCHATAGSPRLGRAHSPAIVDPEPVGRIGADGRFEGAIDVGRDRFHATKLTVFTSRNLVARFDSPPAKRGAKADGGVERAVVAEREESGSGAGKTFVA